MNYKAIAGAIASILSVSALDSSGAETVDTTRVLEEVVVTGTNSGVQQRLLPYTVSVIDNRRLEASGQTQVLSAISGMVPSLFVSQRSIFGFGVSNGGSGHIKLRGVGGDRASAVLMMVDGQPQFAGIYSHHIADFYDKEYVERVEVLRGPGSVRRSCLSPTTEQTAQPTTSISARLTDTRKQAMTFPTTGKHMRTTRL